MVGFRRIGLLGCLIVGLSAPTAMAHADSSTSLNWAGYAVHRHGVKFRKVLGEWQVPTGNCTSGSEGFSAFWVGLGGYSLSSQALEQVGTEFDCTPSGGTFLSAWYEIVPRPPRTIHIRLSPGDRLKARVRVIGKKVTVWLADLTTHQTYRHTVKDRHPDITSAEWIAEAPSECLGISSCQVLPLADFGTIDFTRSTAENTRFRWGGVASGHWNSSRIRLANTNGRRYVSGSSPAAVATPSRLSGTGRSFRVTYSGTPTPVGGGGATVSSVRSRPSVRPLARLGG